MCVSVYGRKRVGEEKTCKSVKENMSSTKFSERERERDLLLTQLKSSKKLSYRPNYRLWKFRELWIHRIDEKIDIAF